MIIEMKLIYVFYWVLTLWDLHDNEKTAIKN